MHCSKAVQRKWCQLKLLCDHHLIEQQPIYLLCTRLGCTKLFYFIRWVYFSPLSILRILSTLNQLTQEFDWKSEQNFGWNSAHILSNNNWVSFLTWNSCIEKNNQILHSSSIAIVSHEKSWLPELCILSKLLKLCELIRLDYASFLQLKHCFLSKND